MKKWKAVDIDNAKYLGVLELENGEYFDILQTEKHLVFGGTSNNGLLQSGHMTIDPDFSIDCNLQELYADLQTYYQEGPEYCNVIVCNDRM